MMGVAIPWVRSANQTIFKTEEPTESGSQPAQLFVGPAAVPSSPRPKMLWIELHMGGFSRWG